MNVGKASELPLLNVWQLSSAFGYTSVRLNAMRENEQTALQYTHHR